MQVLQTALKAYAVAKTDEAQLNYALNPKTETETKEVFTNRLLASNEEQDYETYLAQEMLFGQHLWQGLYSGLYNVNRKGMVPKPGKECLGQWIVEDINQLKEFRHNMVSDYWHIGVDEYEKSWYSTGNLMFKNFDECHFKNVMEDLHAYCTTQVEDETNVRDAVPPMINACSFRLILNRMQTNVFALVTQTSALGATFQQEGWEDQDPEDKAYSYQQLGHTLGQVFVDLTGFKPTVLSFDE